MTIVSKETRRLRIHARSYLDANQSSLQSSSSRDYIYIYLDRMLLARYARINIEYLQVTIYTLSVCKNIYTEKLGSFDQFSLYRIVREDFILFLGSAV